MASLFTFDFWSAQIAAAFEEWAILILLILVFWGVFKIKLVRVRKEMKELKVYADDLDSRLQAVRELNSEESDSLAQFRGQIEELRKSELNNAMFAARLKEVDESAARFSVVNLVTRDYLRAAKSGH